MKHVLTLETSDVETALKDFFKKENVKYEKLEVHSDSDGVFTVSTSGLTLGSETKEPNSVAEVVSDIVETKKDAVDIFGSAV